MRGLVWCGALLGASGALFAGACSGKSDVERAGDHASSGRDGTSGGGASSGGANTGGATTGGAVTGGSTSSGGSSANGGRSGAGGVTGGTDVGGSSGAGDSGAAGSPSGGEGGSGGDDPCPGVTPCIGGPDCQCLDARTGQCIEAGGPIGNGLCRGLGGKCLGCQCASPDTPIATPDGDRPIAELRAGDLVYSVDRSQIRAVPVLRVNRVPVTRHSVLRIEFDRGAVIEMSALHPTADGRALADLAPGSELLGGAVESIVTIPYRHPFTYDILPDSETGAYFADGVLVGSTLRAPQ